MTPKELIQLAQLLEKEATAMLLPYRGDSEALIGETVSLLGNLPGLLENCFDEVACLNELSRETKRAQYAARYPMLIGVIL